MEKKVEKLKGRCKVCASSFEYLESQRKSANFCQRACYNEWLKRKPPVEESIIIEKSNPGWFKKLFSFLTGK